MDDREQPGVTQGCFQRCDVQAFRSAELEVTAKALESLTDLIATAQGGDAAAWDRVYLLLYQDLHRIAASLIRQRKTLRSPTSLISEAWLRLCGADLTLEGRSHLTSLIVRAMRFVLVDEARRALTDKHGHGVAILELWEADNISDGLGPEQLITLDQALTDLGRVDPRLVRVAELRFFGGLEEEEIAEMLHLHKRTVRRDWRKARAFLFQRLGDTACDPQHPIPSA
ncbi:ECF-type sigma factor [Solilutibacter silvestris]|uniref:ECF-type sigma factor n=1 Tax=Solilutibacter silvestris TaxID=1645665 RepID=UPI003D358A1E